MKKLFLILTLLGVFAFANAQKTIQSGSDFWFSQSAALTTSDTESSTIYLAVEKQVGYIVQLSVDSVSGTPSMTTTLYGSVDYVNWFTIGSAITTTTGVDTAYTFLDETGNLYPFLKLATVATATAQSSTINRTWKIWTE
ncbi:MAG: hypothetical protein HN347_12190 [Bacteroidetes bacterium]|jgi:hypothetical protein|nr:hypothetical protein [Bacteroidota bacterium]